MTLQWRSGFFLMGVSSGLPLARGTLGRAGVDERRPSTGDSGNGSRQGILLQASLGNRETLPDTRLLGGLSRERGNCDGCTAGPACSPVLASGWDATGWLAAVVALGTAATDRLAPGRRDCRGAAFSGTVECLVAELRAGPPVASLAGWRLLLEAAVAPAGGPSGLRGSGIAGVDRAAGRWVTAGADGTDGVGPFRAGFDTPKVDPGFGRSQPFGTSDGLTGACAFLANVVSAAVLVAALGRTGTALGLVIIDSRPAGRCTGAGRGDGRLLRTSAVPLVDCWRDEQLAAMITVVSALAEGTCVVAISAGVSAGMAKVVSATATGDPCKATASAVAGGASGMAKVVSATGTGDPFKATASAVGDSLATTNDSPSASNGSGGVLSRLLSGFASPAWWEELSASQSEPWTYVSLFAAGASSAATLAAPSPA